MSKRMSDEEFRRLRGTYDVKSVVAVSIEAERARASEKEAEVRIQEALEIARAWGGHEGRHHRAWTIDQMVRALTGEQYSQWVRDWNSGEEGPDTYAWDEGVAP